MSSKKNFNILPYLLIFLLTFSVTNLLFAPDAKPKEEGIFLEVNRETYPQGKEIIVTLHNNEKTALELPSTCSLEWLQASRYESEKFVSQKIDWNPCEGEKSQSVSVPAGESHRISLKNVSYSLFDDLGRYRIEWNRGENEKIVSNEFTIEKPGLLRSFWQGVIYQPMLNALLALVAWAPNHHLGLSIILLTLLVRTVLLIPSQRAIIAQRRLTLIQPKLEELKAKYAQDQARLAQETMALWKTHKVNPLSSCLPLLIQIPFFLALFSVIQSGLSPDKASLLYSFVPSFNLNDIDPSFLGLNLFEKDWLVLPLIVGLLQYVQIVLTQSGAQAKQSKQGKKEKTPAKENESFDFAKEMQNANKIMKYVLPVMIAFLSATLPAGVGLYWGTSNVFGILQQLYVNHFTSKNPVETNSDDEVQIKVIRKP